MSVLPQSSTRPGTQTSCSSPPFCGFFFSFFNNVSNENWVRQGSTLPPAPKVRMIIVFRSAPKVIATLNSPRDFFLLSRLRALATCMPEMHKKYYARLTAVLEIYYNFSLRNLKYLTINYIFLIHIQIFGLL